MAAFTKKFIMTAIGGTSFTLTPLLGQNASGPVSGTIPAGDQDISSGITTIVVNSTGAPDTTFAHRVGSEVIVTIDTQGA